MTKTIIKKYSTAFKQHVVREYEKGSSIRYLKNKYAIGGNNTIKQWIEKYSRQGLRHKLMVNARRLHDHLSESAGENTPNTTISLLIFKIDLRRGLKYIFHHFLKISSTFRLQPVTMSLR